MGVAPNPDFPLLKRSICRKNISLRQCPSFAVVAKRINADANYSSAFRRLHKLRKSLT
jgi:hypothetical protein